MLERGFIGVGEGFIGVGEGFIGVGERFYRCWRGGLYMVLTFYPFDRSYLYPGFTRRDETFTFIIKLF